MKRNLSLLLAALLALAGLLGLMPAAWAKGTKPIVVHNVNPTPIKPKEHKDIIWTVDAVDTQASFVTLKSNDGQQPKIVRVNFGARITVNGQAGRLEDVQIGQRATFVESAANSVNSLTLTGSPDNPQKVKAKK